MSLYRIISMVVAAGSLLCIVAFSDGSRVDPKLVMALKQAVKETPGPSNQLETLTWLADMSTRLEHRIPDPFYRVQLLKTVHTEAIRSGLRPELVLALIEVESTFDRFAVSRSGARGLMQVMPFWKKEIGHPGDNLFQPRTNLRYGCTILKYYLDLANGDTYDALARYNGSYGKAAYSSRVMLAFNETWQPSSYGFGEQYKINE
jgi:soluble lytic murein transglycosylase-like protein